MDPKVITEALSPLQPKIQSMAGEPRRYKNGAAVSPPRTVQVSVWLARLHDKERLYSGEIELSDFLMRMLNTLKPHRDLFSQICEEGDITLMVGWFSGGNHSAGVLKSPLLELCGVLGVDLELDYYNVDKRA